MEKSVVAFSIPLGIVLFKVINAISYVALVFYFAETYEIGVSISWFILVVFTAAVLSMATPPIPGGATIGYTILFAQFGIPIEALAVTIACDVFLDFICTGFDQFLLSLVVINQTSKLNLINLETLRSDN